MRQLEDKFTLDAFDKPRRGRPRKPNAKTGAERQRDYRARLKKKNDFSSQRNGN